MDINPLYPANFTVTNEPALAMAPADVEKLQVEIGKTLASLGFSPAQSGPPQQLMDVDRWMHYREKLPLNTGLAEWSFATPWNWFWGSEPYSVGMCAQNNTIILIILTNGSKNEIDKIEAVVTEMMNQKFPQLKHQVVFHRMVTAMPP
jgi:hypothetical protein